MGLPRCRQSCVVHVVDVHRGRDSCAGGVAVLGGRRCSCDARFARRFRRPALACGQPAHTRAVRAGARGGRWRSGNAALCSHTARRACGCPFDPLNLAPGGSRDLPSRARRACVCRMGAPAGPGRAAEAVPGIAARRCCLLRSRADLAASIPSWRAYLAGPRPWLRHQRASSPSR
eukprot:COSAG06_NODE_548_length_14433_cov_15.096623_1_plen_175_part_00